MRWHVQKLATHAKMVYRGTRMQWLEDFGAWRRTKFEMKLNTYEKIKSILSWQGIGSRIQVLALPTHYPQEPFANDVGR